MATSSASSSDPTSRRDQCRTHQNSLYVHCSADRDSCSQCHICPAEDSASPSSVAACSSCLRSRQDHRNCSFCCKRCGYSANSPGSSIAGSYHKHWLSNDIQLASPPAPTSPLRKLQQSSLSMLHSPSHAVAPHATASSPETAEERTAYETMTTHTQPNRKQFASQPAAATPLRKLQDSTLSVLQSPSHAVAPCIATSSPESIAEGGNAAATMLQHARANSAQLSSPPAPRSPLRRLQESIWPTPGSTHHAAQLSTSQEPSAAPDMLQGQVPGSILPLTMLESGCSPKAMAGAHSAVASSEKALVQPLQLVSPAAASPMGVSRALSEPHAAGQACDTQLPMQTGSQAPQLRVSFASSDGMLGSAMHAVAASMLRVQQEEAKPNDSDKEAAQHTSTPLQSSVSAQITSALPMDKQAWPCVDTPPVSDQLKQWHANACVTVPEGLGLAPHASSDCSIQPQTMLEMPDIVAELLANLVSSPPETVPPMHANTLPGNQPSSSLVADTHANCMPGVSASAARLGISSASSPPQPSGRVSSPDKRSFLGHSSRPFSAGPAYRLVPDSPRLQRPGSTASCISGDIQTCSNQMGSSAFNTTDISSLQHAAHSTMQSQPQSVCNAFSSEGLVRQQMWLAKQQQQAELSEVEWQYQQTDCSCTDSDGSISSENNLRPSSASRCRHGYVQQCKVSYGYALHMYFCCISTIHKPLSAVKFDLSACLASKSMDPCRCFNSAFENANDDLLRCSARAQSPV